ncbi:MAG: hypothetical protein U5L72_19290 [Bacteroidales bacterium]|nr:hypothetical protein [Bacteroidales bacterium]
MNIRLWHVILFLFVCGPLAAQGDIDPQSRLFWRNERSIGASLNSDGWSVIYRDLRQVKPSHRYFLEGSVEGFKHPKEIKLTNYYFQGTGTYVFGKLNSTWTTGAGVGYQIEIFEKRDLGGVSVSWFGGAGATLLYAKPIYYDVIVLVGQDYYTVEEQKFDLTIHQPLDIMGKASFFKGFDEIKVYPGLYARSGFSFEYSKNDRVTHAIEVGASFHAFSKTIPIMASEDNKQFFPAIFVSYRIGMIVDPLNPGGLFNLLPAGSPGNNLHPFLASPFYFVPLSFISIIILTY